jgi:hypothetical protein
MTKIQCEKVRKINDFLKDNIFLFDCILVMDFWLGKNLSTVELKILDR